MASKQHTAVRVDQETLARIEAFRELFSTKWRDATISDILRALILRGLDKLEHDHRREIKKKRPRSPTSVPKT